MKGSTLIRGFRSSVLKGASGAELRWKPTHLKSPYSVTCFISSSFTEGSERNAITVEVGHLFDICVGEQWPLLFLPRGAMAVTANQNPL